jgi:hypothetical protein
MQMSCAEHNYMIKEFTMNSPGSPRGILINHLPDKGAKIIADFGLAEVFGSGSEMPEQTKSCAIPGPNRSSVLTDPAAIRQSTRAFICFLLDFPTSNSDHRYEP